MEIFEHYAIRRDIRLPGIDSRIRAPLTRYALLKGSQ
jgi:hypothetical protein